MNQPTTKENADMNAQLDKAQKSIDRLFATRNDRWYPQCHIASKAGWINDPNGLSYYKGRYHAYFQLNP